MFDVIAEWLLVMLPEIYSDFQEADTYRLHHLYPHCWVGYRLGQAPAGGQGTSPALLLPCRNCSSSCIFLPSALNRAQVIFMVWPLKHRGTAPTNLWTPHPPADSFNPSYPSVQTLSLTLCLQNRWPSVPSVPCARNKPDIQILALPPLISVPLCL